MKETIGEYIKKLRTENKLTLTQLAAKLDMDSANLSKIENGKRELDDKRLEKLAKVFKLNLRELKDEYFSELFAKQSYKYRCSENVFELAEKKIQYIISKNVKQSKLEI